jgi:hypothetical protein
MINASNIVHTLYVKNECVAVFNLNGWKLCCSRFIFTNC